MSRHDPQIGTHHRDSDPILLRAGLARRRVVLLVRLAIRRA